eukprot:CAMPEP_0203670450 /NCGR_PEP_ID=MMETSP0090-20130426/6519_1 /ASSEMBLY_ACC=CAM_ASM_001088 /TAXON_ID=426623 /ORGANISM="Chaetoceros affinis, Strain CCMP159" /LENGTH=583 /DNA_ID=CAMNT_0050535311 /DNA_START=65 /DNA_END=1816 /DNA_ORIENTATION=-
MMLERVRQTLTAANNNVRSTLHQFAAKGDVEAVQSLVKHYHTTTSNSNNLDGVNNNFDIDIHSSRSKVTALHAALIQNQQGFIIDYLLSEGADVDAFNQKGFNPVILAIRHCRPDTHALEKLIDAGAYLGQFQKGRFASLSPLDIALLWKNERAVEILEKKGGMGGTSRSIAESQGNSKGDDKCNGGNDGDNSNNDKNGQRMNKDVEQRTRNEKWKSKNKKGRASTPKKKVCPLCNCLVKFPSRMSFLEYNQCQAEKEYELLIQRQRDRDDSDPLPLLVEEETIVENKTKTQEKKKTAKTSANTNKSSKIYISRKYLDQFMSHLNGQAYKKLCSVEYHGVNNMGKMRKEISESYSVLHAVQQCWIDLKDVKKEEEKKDIDAQIQIQTQLPSNTTSISFENVFLIDLCSGKSLTTALSAVLLERKNNKLLAVDKLPAHMVPHFLHDGNTSYLSRDIMSKIFFDELKREVYRQCTVEGRIVILVGMHLCGKLSERAIEFFEKMPLISAIVLSPCCLPKFRKGKVSFVKTDVDEEDAYLAWANHLKVLMEQCLTNVDYDAVKSYRDDEMHSIKNSIITAIRQPAIV